MPKIVQAIITASDLERETGVTVIQVLELGFLTLETLAPGHRFWSGTLVEHFGITFPQADQFMTILGEQYGWEIGRVITKPAIMDRLEAEGQRRRRERLQKASTGVL